MRTTSMLLLAPLTLTACTVAQPSGDPGKAMLTIATVDGKQSVRFGAGTTDATLRTLTLHGLALEVNDGRCLPDDSTHGTMLTCTVNVAVPGGRSFVLPSKGVQVVDADYLRDGKGYTLSTD
jgi:hypothetical protein